MMNATDSEKLKKKLSSLSTFIIKHGITRNDINDICMDNESMQICRDVIGRVLCIPFEWRVHPVFQEIECSTDGQIRVSGKIVQPEDINGVLKIRLSRKRKLNAALLILNTFKPIPKDGNYVHRFRNDDYKDLRIANLYWYRLQ